jgi:hypothetical protein
VLQLEEQREAGVAGLSKLWEDALVRLQVLCIFITTFFFPFDFF